MGALVGVWSRDEKNTIELVNKMATKLKLFEHDFLNVYRNNHLSVGYVHQKCRSVSQFVQHNERYFLTFIGDIRNDQELKKSENLTSRNVNTAELLIHIYEKYQERMVLKLNGIFAILVYDKSSRSATLMNDRLGQIRLYYRTIGDTIIFASKVKALLAYSDERLSVNTATLLDLFLYRSPMQNESLFKDIHLLPPATIWTITPSGNVKTNYWSLEEQIASPLNMRQGDQYEHTRFLFNQAVRRCLEAPVTFTFGLTSGLDSRCILSAIESKTHGVRCFTRGTPNNPDVVIAQKLAETFQLPFERKEVVQESSNIFAEKLKKAAYLTEGLGNMESAVYLNSVVECRENSEMERQLTGTLGNQTMRIPLFFANKPYAFAVMEDAFLGKIPVGHKSLTALFDKFFANIVKLYIGISDPTQFFNDSFLTMAKERFYHVNKTIYSTADEIGYKALGGKLHYIALKYLIQNCFPARNPMCEIYYRTPFIDIEFFEHMARIPLSMKSELKTVLHHYIIEKNNPVLTNIPYYSKARIAYFNKASQRQWRGRLKTEIPRTALFELGHRMRGDLKDITTNLLLKGDIWCHNFLNKKYVTQMVLDHLDGKINATYAISNLIMFELWHQQFATYLDN